MPLIRFVTKKDEGGYLLITTGEVGWFPEGVGNRWEIGVSSFFDSEK
jgi:hypothetical protein